MNILKFLNFNRQSQNLSLNEVKEIIRDTMENIYKLDVPLKVEINYGKDWYEAK